MKTKIQLFLLLSLILNGCAYKSENEDAVAKLVKAVQDSNFDAAQQIVDHHPELLNKVLDGQYALLHTAINDDNEDLFDFLIRNKAEIDIVTIGSKETSLHLAAAQNRIKMAKLLIDNGAQVNCTTEGGATPLHEACLYGKSEMVSLLLSSGSHIEAKTGVGQTPLCFACFQMEENEDVLKIMRLLLSKGANPDPPCFQNDSLIRFTISGSHFQKAKLLEEYGAVLKLQTSDGLKPYTVEQAQQLYRQMPNDLSK